MEDTTVSKQYARQDASGKVLCCWTTSDGKRSWDFIDIEDAQAVFEELSAKEVVFAILGDDVLWGDADTLWEELQAAGVRIRKPHVKPD